MKKYLERIDYECNGFFDKLYILFRGTGDPKVDLDSYEFERPQITRASSDYWLCFLQGSTEKLEGAVPSKENVLRYVLPSRAISSTPFKTRDLLGRIARKAHEDILDRGIKNQELNFLAISTSNSIPFYLMGNYGYKPRRFVSITPGLNLAEVVVGSIATKKVVRKIRKTGQDPHKVFEEALGVFNPKNYLNFLIRETRLDIHLASFDKMVPPEQGEAFVRELNSRGLEPNITRHPHGHGFTVINALKHWQDEI